MKTKKQKPKAAKPRLWWGVITERGNLFAGEDWSRERARLESRTYPFSKVVRVEVRR